MYTCLYMPMCMGAGCACVPWDTYVLVRGQLVEVDTIIMWIPGSNSSHQTW